MLEQSKEQNEAFLQDKWAIIEIKSVSQETYD